MSYISRSLGAAETVLYRAHFPFFYKTAGAVILIAAAIAAFFAYANNLAWVALALVVAGVALSVAVMLRVWTTEICVTNQRFIYKRGLWSRLTHELQLRAVEEVNLRQGLIGRLFDCGKLDLRGTGVDDISLPLLADPVGLRKALQDGMAAATQPIAPVVNQPMIAAAE